MEHTDYTGSIKTAARAARRRDDWLTIAEQLGDTDVPHDQAERS